MLPAGNQGQGFVEELYEPLSVPSAFSTPAEEGGYVVTCRDLPELVTQGETVEDALEQAADAMDEVFATYLTEGVDFPQPSKAKRREHWVAPPAETVARQLCTLLCARRASVRCS